jgi:hypothetical protein
MIAQNLEIKLISIYPKNLVNAKWLNENLLTI